MAVRQVLIAQDQLVERLKIASGCTGDQVRVAFRVRIVCRASHFSSRSSQELRSDGMLSGIWVALLYSFFGNVGVNNLYKRVDKK